MMSSRQTNPASICGHNHEDGGSVRSWWSWRSQSPDCFYWKWFWMRNERVNMQEARLLSYILYSHPGFSSILKSVIPFPVYVQCYLQEALNISILLISAAAAAAWGVSVLHSVSVAICNTKYGLSAWISAVAHPTDSMIAMTARSPHTHAALYLRGRSSDTSCLLTQHLILILSPAEVSDGHLLVLSP